MLCDSATDEFEDACPINDLKSLQLTRGAAMSAKFDAVIIGRGQSGPSSVARMIREGMKMAIIETEALRRRMSARRLHSNQNTGGERTGRIRATARPGRTDS